MKVITDQEFADFLTTKPLYFKLKAVEYFLDKENTYTNYLDFEEKAFRFNCPQEKEIHTFRTTVWGSKNMMFGRPDPKYQTEDSLPYYFDKDTNNLDITIPLIGHCQSCRAVVYFLIKAYSDKSFERRSEGINIYLQKIGQFPPYDIEPEKIVQKYLTDEDNAHYKKALTNLSVSYGIGAFAYFRRIIENEIKRIIKDLSELEFDGANEIKKAYLAFEKDHQMNNLIHSITPLLPKSLSESGDNPIKLLYEQLSDGIHTFSEDECLQKAQQINILLPYIIKKVNEEKFQLKDIKDAIRKLRNGG